MRTKLLLMSLLSLSSLGCTVHLHLHIGEENYELDKKKLMEIADNGEYFKSDNRNSSTQPSEGLENGSDGISWMRDWLNSSSRQPNE